MLRRFTLIFLMIITGAAIFINCSKTDVVPKWKEVSGVCIKSNILSSEQDETDSVQLITYVYLGDSLIRRKSLIRPSDTINISPGNYKFITISNTPPGVKYENLVDFSKAKVVVDSSADADNSRAYTPGLYASSVSDFTVSRYFQNTLELNLANRIKKLEYQLIIDGARDSLEKVIIVQNGVYQGFVLSTNKYIFDSTHVNKLYAEAMITNDFTGSFRLLGLSPENRDVEIQFIYKNNKIQNATLDLSHLKGESMYSKKLIMYIDIQRIDIELKASIKSWVLIEDKITI